MAARAGHLLELESGDLVDLARRLAPEELDAGLRVLVVLAELVRTTGKCEQCIGVNIDCEEFADDDCEQKKVSALAARPLLSAKIAS
ncbi:hypothetical protein [Enhygromyxa salina]|uniref:hypothetical protein n=1 Tax=Enhygromyxa salina TaxID=215803 RepID=UPI000D092EC9|nr:hypothetical protein [Enhygromyxa salina]